MQAEAAGDREVAPSLRQVLADPGVRRSLLGLFGAQAAATSALTTSVSLSSILVTQIAGSATLSGLPATLNMLAAAASAFVAGMGMARFGRRAGLLSGYLLGALGSAVGFIFALSGNLPGFLLGGVLVGAAQAVILQGRYAAADLVPAAVRGRVVGLILFGAVVGAVVAALLTPLLQRVASSLRVPALELGWAQSALMLAVGAGLILVLFRNPGRELSAARPARVGLSQFLFNFSRPEIRLGVINLVLGQSVMVMLMNLFPIHALHHGHGLSTISAIISVHVAGMFGLAWLTGGLVDRFGAWIMSTAGGVMLFFGALASALQTSTVGLAAALFLIGLGWNLCFVAGSALLAKRLEPSIRSSFQGSADVLVWLCAGSSTLGGGFLVGAYDYPAVGVLGGLAAAGLLLLVAFTWVRLHPPAGRGLAPD
ncbi:MAG: MFS transporter [Candidatus Dormibacteraeota bacterium]|nr:MFS transporter [Candidatus Dormibacteraeota bacterium]